VMMRTLLIAGAIASLMAGLAGPAVADVSEPTVEARVLVAPDETPDAGDSGARVVLTEEEALAEDLAMAAASEGISVEEATARYGGMGPFSEAVARLQDSSPDDYIHAQWGDGAGVVYVRPGAAGAAEGTIREARAVGEVIELEAPNAATQEVIQIDLIDRIRAITSSPIDTSWNISSGLPSISVEIGADPSAARGGSTLTAQVEALSEEIGFPLEVTVAPGLAAAEPAAVGGIAFGTCTGGFIVNSHNVSGAWGILIARHCPGSMGYDGAQFVSTIYEANRDLRVTRLTGATPYAEFRSNWGTYRHVNGSGNPVAGQRVCKFGMQTGYTCSDLRPGVHCSYIPGEPTFCNIYRTQEQHVVKGDSGGPWFWGTEALGITSGYDDVHFQYDTFTGLAPGNFWGLGYQMRTK
jgi:streptogrisin C